MTAPGRPGRTVADLVHERAASAPEAIAVVDAGFRPLPGTSSHCPRPPHGIRRLSYGEVSDRAKGLAHRLRQLGVGPGAVVAVLAQRSPELLIGLLGVLTCGAGYLPLDPDHPPKRLSKLLSDTKPTLVLTQPELKRRVKHLDPTIQVESVVVEPGGHWDEPASHQSYRQSAGLDDLAYVGYRDRDPGSVIGVEIEHRSLLGLITALSAEFGGGPDDAWLTITGATCPASLPTLLLPLVVGARVVLADQAAAVDGRALLELVHRYQVSYLPASPRIWRSLLAAGLPESDLVALVIGSDVERELAREIRQRVRRMSTMSGSLETTIWAMTCPVPADPECVPIGRPMIHSQIYLFDEWFCPVPPGVPGEMYVGGPCVARGYHDRPELTSQRFLPDPYHPDQGRLFRTGQLARWRDSHRLEYVGPAN